MSFRHGIARTIGAALGLFAMLVVTLLAPVHQAHAAQRDLARVSGEWLAVSAICHGDALSQADGLSQDIPADADGKGAAVKCPICSLAKQWGAMPVPALAGMPGIWRVSPTPVLTKVAVPAASRQRAAQPRAPPIQV